MGNDYKSDCVLAFDVAVFWQQICGKGDKDSDRDARPVLGDSSSCRVWDKASAGHFGDCSALQGGNTVCQYFPSPLSGKTIIRS